MQKDAPSDQELTLKKRARRRLVGAVALVLLMVIVLPMILKDRANTQPSDEITITLSNQKPASNPTPEVSDFDSNVIPTEANPQDKQSAADDSANQTSEAQQTSMVDLPDPEAEVSKPKQENQKADVKKIEENKAEQNKTEPNKSSTGSKFYVQIGVFSDEANVKQLQAKLSDLGYKSQTEKIDTTKGKKIRLRTQLLGERNEAAIALQNIKDAGLTGMVVSQ